MIGSTAFFFSALLLNPGGLLGTELSPPDPGLNPEVMAAAHASPLALSGMAAPTALTVYRDTMFAQRRSTTPHPAPAEQPADTEGLPGSSTTDASPHGATPATPATTTESTATPGATAPAADESCSDIDCDTYHEAERNSTYVLHRRTRILRTHRTFAIAAWCAMVVTEALGTVLAINEDTWFGRGTCASSPTAFGCQNETLITGLHETSAFITEGLYTTAGVLAVAAPDPENASEGNGAAESTLRLHKALAYVHGAGMILLPILGVLSTTPQMFGITSNEGRADFSRAMRSVHTIVGYATLITLTWSAYLEIF